MTKPEPSRIAITTPSAAMQQLCNLVAIAETKSPTEILRELILHILSTFESERFEHAEDCRSIMGSLFGIDVPVHQVEEALNWLASNQLIHRPLGTNVVLAPEARERVRVRIENAIKLEKSVRQSWIEEIELTFPGLDTEQAWGALKDYLAKAFIRHGIQVAVFLDPSVELPKQYAASLSTLLSEAVNSHVSQRHRDSARHAISDFLGSGGGNEERSQFIAECSDGAANYFSLAVAPTVAETLRNKLESVVLFCDTNFLFGILDLHIHPLVDVSNHLLDAITVHKLPFKLRFHEATLNELVRSITHYSGELRKHKWSQALSKAASQSRFVSGIELKFHQKNAEMRIDADLFLRPYNHVVVLLKEKNLDIFRPNSDRLIERATLEAEYNEYLSRHQKEKPYESVMHDVTVLDCVRSMRSEASTVLDAGALFLTCDYTLYRFDSERSQLENLPSAVVLPNILWQILRPYVPSTPDFDRSFAETFAIPEFRTIGSGASEACSRMLGLLAAYQDFPEETATRMLSNDLLIDRLRSIRDDEQFRVAVESGIVDVNQELLEERMALEQENSVLKLAKREADSDLEKQRMAADVVNAQLHDTQETLQAKQTAMEELAMSKAAADKSTIEITFELNEAKDDAKRARTLADSEVEARSKADARANRQSVIAALSLSACIIIAFEWIVYGLPWSWVQNHPNSYGLQAAFASAVVAFLLGLMRPELRKVWWVVVLSGVVIGAIFLLGGPSKPTSTTNP